MSKFTDALGQISSASGMGRRIKKQLGDESYHDLLVALGNRDIPIPAILRALRSLEISISRAAVMRWRNGEPPKGADMPIVKEFDNE